MCSLFVGTPQATAQSPDTQSVEDQVEQGVSDSIIRLYLGLLGRQPDDQGFDYWLDRYVNGDPLLQIAHEFVVSNELVALQAGDSNEAFLDNLYQQVLGRSPDHDGSVYWLEQLSGGMERSNVVLLFTESPEFVAITQTATPVSPPHWSCVQYQDFVDAGNGVCTPLVLHKIRDCESGDRLASQHAVVDSYDYSAVNAHSSARGAYQFLKSTWAGEGFADAYDAPTALDATPAQQDEAALLHWFDRKERPWTPSRDCWSRMSDLLYLQ